MMIIDIIASGSSNSNLDRVKLLSAAGSKKRFFTSEKRHRCRQRNKRWRSNFADLLRM